ncbi:hypothetical protein BJ878DRAFT_526168, partial [Calycina marina]
MDSLLDIPDTQPWGNNIVELEDETWQFERERIYAEREVIEEDILEPEIITVSSNASINPTKVERVIFAEELPEYPVSSDGGIAYIINVINMREEQVNMMCQNVQYCRKRTHPPKACHSSILNNAYCQRFSYSCAGATE